MDALFRVAVAAIDSGDVASLDGLLRQHPKLAEERLREPGAWLRDKVGNALDGFFQQPYLLWFVAEDPVRTNTLAPNIAEVARTIIEAAKRVNARTLQEQIDYALSLVAWSWVAEKRGVQLQLLDVLIEAGGSPDGVPENALVNGHVDAARHLIERGAPLTLSTALLLERWADAEELARTASSRVKQNALVLSALNGRPDALSLILRAGVEVSVPSEEIYAHATPLHHAVCSGSLEAVKVLVGAGAALNVRDMAEHATPLGWAEYYRDEGAPERRAQFAAIATYLSSLEL